MSRSVVPRVGRRFESARARRSRRERSALACFRRDDRVDADPRARGVAEAALAAQIATEGDDASETRNGRTIDDERRARATRARAPTMVPVRAAPRTKTCAIFHGPRRFVPRAWRRGGECRRRDVARVSSSHVTRTEISLAVGRPNGFLERGGSGKRTDLGTFAHSVGERRTTAHACSTPATHDGVRGCAPGSDRVPPEDERRRRVRVRAAREGRRCVLLLTGRMKERTLAPSASIPRRGRPLSRDPSSTIDRVVRARRSRDGIAAIDVRASLANARAGQFVLIVVLF